LVIEGRASENEVAAELLDDQGRTAAIYRLDVSAADNKLGGQAFAAMVEAILDFDPALVVGTEEAQFGIGHDGALTNAHLQYARLRRYGDRSAYARAYRFGWYALRSGWLGKDPDETLWVSPTWQVYERWCFVTVVSQLQRQFPELVWSREYRSVGLKEIVWRGIAACDR